jgi:hypothetical protein
MVIHAVGTPLVGSARRSVRKVHAGRGVKVSKNDSVPTGYVVGSAKRRFRRPLVVADPAVRVKGKKRFRFRPLSGRIVDDGQHLLQNACQRFRCVTVSTVEACRALLLQRFELFRSNCEGNETVPFLGTSI